MITNVSSGGAGIGVADGDSISAVDVNGTAGPGITVTNANTFTIASSVTITGALADGIDVSGGGGDASVDATITGSAGHAVNVQSRTSGTLAFRGSITDAGGGLLLFANTGATIDFFGAISSSTTNSPAFKATGGGTVEASSAANALTSTAARALDVESTAIGSGGITFQSINSGTSGSGPDDGVFLSNTGTGTLTVNGGTIQGTTGAAVSASGSGGVSLVNMLLEPASGAGVAASAVASLSVRGSTITGGGGGIAATGNSSPQSFTIEGNILSGQSATAIALTTNGPANVFVHANKIGDDGPPPVVGSTTGDGIDISPTSGTTNAAVTDNRVYQVHNGYGIRAQASAGATLALTFTGNIVSMTSASPQDGVFVASLGAGADVCIDPRLNTVSAAGNSTSANAMEIRQIGGSTFALASYPGSTDAEASAFLSSANPSLTAGLGSAAVATSADGFTNCTAPDTGNT